MTILCWSEGVGILRATRPLLLFGMLFVIIMKYHVCGTNSSSFKPLGGACIVSIMSIMLSNMARNENLIVGEQGSQQCFQKH